MNTPEQKLLKEIRKDMKQLRESIAEFLLDWDEREDLDNWEMELGSVEGFCANFEIKIDNVLGESQ